jgi:hypothetical protein
MSSGGQQKAAQANALSRRLHLSNENLLASYKPNYIRIFTLSQDSIHQILTLPHLMGALHQKLLARQLEKAGVTGFQ